MYQFMADNSDMRVVILGGEKYFPFVGDAIELVCFDILRLNKDDLLAPDITYRLGGFCCSPIGSTARYELGGSGVVLSALTLSSRLCTADATAVAATSPVSLPG